MRPHRLRVTAFGAFAGTEEIRFDDLEGLFLLHGETGAGKTTLLDAIAFALYGRVPGERGKVKRLRSDHAAVGVTTEVELEATVGSRRLRITRSPEQERPKRSGTGMTKAQAAVRLEEATAAGGWEVKSTRVGEADAEILGLMGMSADQFFQVVLLPQGQFAQFLHADADARAKLLEKLFGTDRFRAVEQWLAEYRRKTASDVDAAARRVDELMARISQVAGEPMPDETSRAEEGDPGDPGRRGSWQVTWVAGRVSAAKGRSAESARLVEERTTDLAAARVAKTEADELAGRQRRRGEALRKRCDLESAAPAIVSLRAEAEAAARAAEVASALAAADRAEKKSADARQAEEDERRAIPAEQEPLRAADPEALRAAGDDQRAQLGRLETLRSVAAQAAEEGKAAAGARKRAAQRETELGTGQAAIAERRQQRERAVAERDAASQAAEALPDAKSAAESRKRAAGEFAGLVKARAERARSAEAHRVAVEGARERNRDYRRIHQARIDGMRAELAKDLVEGAPCPVCGSPVHPKLCELPGALVSHEEEEQAYALAEAADEKADKAGLKVAAADERIDDLIRRLADAGVAAPEDVTTLDAAARAAAADAKRLKAEADRLAAAAAGLSGLQRVLDDLDQAIADGERKQAELSEQRKAAVEEADGADQRAAAARRELCAQLGGAADLDAAVIAATQLADRLTAAAAAADATARAAQQLREAGDRAASEAAAAGFGGTDEARAALRTQQWRAEAADRIKRHETDAEAVASQLADPELDVPLDPPAPVAARAQAADEAQRNHAAAVRAHGTAEHTAGQLRRLEPQLLGALNDLAPVRERADQARQLADLAGGLGANQYKMTLSSFVLAARLEEVAAAASQRLVTMTAGRYTLVHTDARRGGGRAGLGLLACDSWTGQDRDTSTLSGGETFLASLALALGLADVVTAEAAGTPMEALFVDEGFGTLDEDTLEEVMTVLDGLREGGRIVGIVSHVSELRQRIPARVHVRKGHHGSHVAVTTG